MIIWRFFSWKFFRVFALFIVAFVAFIFAVHLEELTTLITAGLPSSRVLFFILLQIPFVLPMAIPVAALFASTTLFAGLSHTLELTALRANGLSLKSILKPLLTIAVLLSLFNFLLTSEIATRAHLASRKLLVELTTKNPLFLLEHASLSYFKEGFIKVESVKRGEKAKNLIAAKVNGEASRLMLMLAKDIQVKEKQLCAHEITLFFPLSAENFYLENITEASGSSIEWASLLQPHSWKLAWDYLPWRMMIQEFSHLKRVKNKKNSQRESLGRSEVIRRFSMGLAPLSFSLIGALFAIQIGRQKSLKPFFILTVSASLSLIAFFAAHSLSNKLYLSICLYTLPHLTLILLALHRLRAIEEGRDVAF